LLSPVLLLSAPLPMAVLSLLETLVTERVFTHGYVLQAGRIGKKSVRSVCCVVVRVVVKECLKSSGCVAAASDVERQSVRSVRGVEGAFGVFR
jgi:hypothetical protein